MLYIDSFAQLWFETGTVFIIFAFVLFHPYRGKIWLKFRNIVYWGFMERSGFRWNLAFRDGIWSMERRMAWFGDWRRPWKMGIGKIWGRWSTIETILDESLYIFLSFAIFLVKVWNVLPEKAVLLGIGIAPLLSFLIEWIDNIVFLVVLLLLFRNWKTVPSVKLRNHSFFKILTDIILNQLRRKIKSNYQIHPNLSWRQVRSK